MIKVEEVKKLATLARIDISFDEAERLTKEIDSILEYVREVQAVSSDEAFEKPILKNIMREDVITSTKGEFTTDFLNLAPQKEKNYFKVKKILS